MGREILITGDEILYRDVVAGQPKPAWKKGPSVNLSPLLFPDATTRMQVSGNQYMQLSTLQAFFAQAFADIEHDHDDLYAPAGAQVNVIESMYINDLDVPITSKALKIYTDETITVRINNGVMTVRLSDKYKNLIYAGL